jgi:CRISPR-associated protein Cmx8
VIEAKDGMDPTLRVYNLVRAYVMSRTERKCGIAWESFRDRRSIDQQGRERIDVPDKYKEARAAVCTDAFLRIRSCRSRQDFIDYFTGTLCSVPQFLPQAEFEQVSAALLDGEQWEDIKALTMLALSGLSTL